MRNGFIRLCKDDCIKDRAMFVIENWRAQKSPVFDFLYGIEAIRRKLLTKEETKKLLVEMDLCVAQKRRKPRGNEDEIKSNLSRHRVWSKAYKKACDRLEAIQEYNTKNELRLWLPQDNTNKKPKLRNTKTQITEKINGYTENDAATAKNMAASCALEDFRIIKEMRAWLAQEDGIKNHIQSDKQLSISF